MVRLRIYTTSTPFFQVFLFPHLRHTYYLGDYIHHEKEKAL